MDLLPTEEQTQIVSSVRDVLRREFSADRLRVAQGPFADGSRCQWSMIAELGWFALGVPEPGGGMGQTLAEEALLFRELGRHLVSPNVLAAVLCAHTAHAAGRTDLTQAFASGASRPALVVPLQSLKAGDEVPVYVVDGADSAWMLAWDEQAAWLIDRSSLRGARAVQGVDSNTPLERATLDVASAAHRAGPEVALRADVLIAALQVGHAEAVRDMAVDHAKVREQFGRPIGGFQAIKHRCADMAVACEVGWCQTALAAVRVRDGAADAQREAAAARLLAQSAAEGNAAANIQVHGAMGFSDECLAHHYLKRALLLKHLGKRRSPYAALLSQATS